jgi:hypothetical protein
MALNFGILDPDAPAKLAGSVFAGQQEQQKNMLAQQQMQAGAQQLQTGRLQQQTSQMQMDQMIRDRDALAKLQQQFVANGKSPDLEVNADAMIQSGIPHYVDIGFKLKQTIMQQKQFAAAMSDKAPAAAAPVAAPAPAPAAATPTPVPSYEPAPGAVPIRQGFTPGTSITTFNTTGRPTNVVVPDVTNNIAPPVVVPGITNNMVPAPNPAAANVDTLRRKRDALLSMGTPQAIAAARALDADIAIASREPVYHNVPGVGLVDPRTEKIIVAEQNRPTDLQRNYEYAKGQGFKGDIFAYEKALKEAGRTPAQPRAEQPLEKVIDPVTGQIRFASRTEALSGRMTPASESQGLPAKEIQKRESVLPQATQSVKATEQNADSLIADLQALKDHAGLSGITGFIAGRTTNLSGPARSAQADFNKIKAQGTLGVLTALRAASKTGGALGNTSDKDVQLLGNAFGALDQTQNTEDFKKKLDDAIYATQRAKQNAREAYDSTYEYKTTAPGRPAPANNAVDTSNPLLK